MDLVDPQLRKHLQLVVDEEVVGPEAREEMRRITPHTPVVVSGQLQRRVVSKNTIDVAGMEGQNQAASDMNGPRIVYHTQPDETDDGTIAKTTKVSHVERRLVLVTAI